MVAKEGQQITLVPEMLAGWSLSTKPIQTKMEGVIFVREQEGCAKSVMVVGASCSVGLGPWESRHLRVSESQRAE